ncbi:response regulator transcription factor [Subtercola boreus]|uniref:DNA-binding response regulator n=1 Tax=Subtercola boreus TaxID=120213 RepID=A0A3E0W859_9MICO|nr:response regulator transcription factor [Subtercola boreus]RFA18085.1 DNA-binding response regulator [Subtercola boreus]RFA18467.1 DNA-binding response regulator [Subtercola boreus]RFA24995.1 DNA-binding response regulator [Subtercola boreus]
MRILVVEDDVRIADVLRRALAEAGYAVDVTHSSTAALEAFALESHDLVILDLLLPGLPGGGMEVCRSMRVENSDVPILMLTAVDSPRNRVLGLDAGADDYLTKPFHLQELLARVRALLRRAPRADHPIVSVGGVSLNPATRVAVRAERTIPLTSKEFAVLEYLMRNSGTIVSASELIDHAWDGNYDGYSNVVQTYIRYLRQKVNIPGESDFIRTHRGMGYSVGPST